MTRPPPLTPDGCDLRSHTYFPLHYDRLLRSKWWRRASDLARSRNVDMWAHAFREVPAASLPDDDIDLADAAGFGRDVAGFVKVKAELLEPWVLCDDGRWYHATLAEVANDLWDRMDGKRRANRERQNARRLRLKDAAVTPKKASVTRDTPPMSRVTPPSDDPPVTLQNAVVTLQTGPKERKGDLGANAPVAPAAPDATAKAVSEPWKVDPNFALAWAALTLMMRRRGKSKAITWPLWKRVAAKVGSDNLLLALRRYLKDDEDVQRTGGPGFDKWLRDGRWEAWLPSAPGEQSSWSEDHWKIAVSHWRETGEWGATIGPAPGQPGCRVPPHLLLNHIDEEKARA